MFVVLRSVKEVGTKGFIKLSKSHPFNLKSALLCPEVDIYFFKMLQKCAEELPIPISVSMKCLKCTFFIWCQLQACSQVLFDNQMGNTKGFPS